MSDKKYRLTKQANKDLNDIWIFTRRKWSKRQADRYYSLILAEIEFIAANYLSGKSIKHIRKEYRVTRMKSHLIFYRKSKHVIEIVRILHQKMDIENLLK